MYLNFPHEFYDDEVRCDFYIPSMIKRTWAAGLQILSDIDEVCKRHNIQYFAEWGTLLGTIRHQGYIPWDDDLDICMKRKDYELFLSVASQELPEGYSIVNYKTAPEYRQMLSRVVNTDHYRFDAEFMSKFSGLPFAMGIDIFPMDYISDNEEYEKERHDRVYLVQDTLQALEEEGLTRKYVQNALRSVESICHTRFVKDKTLTVQLRTLLETIYGEVSEEDATYITLYPLWFKNPSSKYPKAYYADSIRMPFENITIPVSPYYHEILTCKYGSSYLTAVKSGGAHSYPYFQNHIDVLKEHFDFEWPTYHFDINDLLSPKREKNITFHQILTDTLNSIRAAHDIIINTFRAANYEEVIEQICYCQNQAIYLGSLIEMRYHLNTESVHVLENYCELLYKFSLEISNATSISENVDEYISELCKLIEDFTNIFNTELSGQKLALIISPSAKYYPSLADAISLYQNKGYIVKIMPVPHIEISPDMKSANTIFDIEEYPQGNYVNYEDFDLSVHPDLIVCNYPYDEYNLLYTVANTYYSHNLAKNTEHLVYVPFNKVSSISPDEERSIKNLKYCLNYPMLAFCDEIIVSNKELKTRYVDALVKQSDLCCKDYWESKITINKALTSSADVKASSTKHIMFYIGIGRFFYNVDTTLEKLRKNFDIFRLNSDRIKVVLLENVQFQEVLSSRNPELISKYNALLEEYIHDSNIIHTKSSSENFSQLLNICDAYYGDPSWLVTEFTNNGKPVMIQE